MLYRRYRPLETRLLQHPDQTGVLTVEQENLNQRVSAVSNAFKATGFLVLAADFLFRSFDVAQPNLQPQLRDQITQLLLDLFADVGVQMQYFESKVRQLEGVDVNDVQ